MACSICAAKDAVIVRLREELDLALALDAEDRDACQAEVIWYRWTCAFGSGRADVKLLKMLADRAGRTVPREDLYDTLIGDRARNPRKQLDVLTFRARKLIARAGLSAEVEIEVISGVGLHMTVPAAAALRAFVAPR